MSVVYFPQLSSGIMTQRPYRFSQAFNSVLSDTPAGRPYGFVKRGSGLTYYPTGPLGKWDIYFTSITDAEVQTLRTFFASVQGRVGEFVFLVPEGNLVPNSENFSDASWSLSGITVGSAVTDPFGGNRATTLTSTISNASLTATVVPAGFVPTFWFCLSLYAKAHSAGQNLALGFQDAGHSNLAQAVFALPQNQWTRIYCPFQMPGGNNTVLNAVIGGNGTWASTAIDVFGVHCCPTGGLGDYLKSPANFGLHNHCRFDVDMMEIRTVGPNENSVTLPIVEYNV